MGQFEKSHEHPSKREEYRKVTCKHCKLEKKSRIISRINHEYYDKFGTENWKTMKVKVLPHRHKSQLCSGSRKFQEIECGEGQWRNKF